MNDALQVYRDLDRKLTELRQKNNGHDSPEEDALLDEMDVAWYRDRKSVV